MKRYIFDLSDCDALYSRFIISMGRCYLCSGWTKEFKKKDIRKFIISIAHHQKSSVVVTITITSILRVAQLWDLDTGDKYEIFARQIFDRL